MHLMSKVVVLLLLIYCLMYFPFFCGGSVFVFVLVCITLYPFQLCNYPEDEERPCCFAFTVIRMDVLCMLMLCCSSSRWHGLVCSVLLWYCGTCEAWSIHRDHDSLCVVVVVGGVGVTLLVSDQLHLKGCIYFIQSLKKIKHH